MREREIKDSKIFLGIWLWIVYEISFDFFLRVSDICGLDDTQFDYIIHTHVFVYLRKCL